MPKQNKIKFDTSELKKLEHQMKRFQSKMASKQAEKILDTELRKAVKPWQDAVNGGWMYKWLNEHEGRLNNPFGNTKIKGKRKFVYGRRVGPKMKGKTGGWFAHFFASPARQLKAKHKIPFFQRFRGKNGTVAALAIAGINKAVKLMANTTFR